MDFVEFYCQVRALNLLKLLIKPSSICIQSSDSWDLTTLNYSLMSIYIRYYIFYGVYIYIIYIPNEGFEITVLVRRRGLE